mgnify:CR=1 FL=1
MIIIIDNYDSFTYNLVHYFEMLNASIQVIRNDKIDVDGLRHLNPDGIVISPGPCTPREAGISLEVIEAFKGQVPILGICLGHQAIGMHFGAQIVRGKEPVHGKVFAIIHGQLGLFEGLPSPFNVTRYHSLQIQSEGLPECLEITALTEDGIIMGIRHKHFDIEGVQFHPEAILTQFGHELLKNFLNRVERSCKLSY